MDRSARLSAGSTDFIGGQLAGRDERDILDCSVSGVDNDVVCPPRNRKTCSKSRDGDLPRRTFLHRSASAAAVGLAVLSYLADFGNSGHFDGTCGVAVASHLRLRVVSLVKNRLWILSSTWSVLARRTMPGNRPSECLEVIPRISAVPNRGHNPNRGTSHRIGIVHASNTKTRPLRRRFYACLSSTRIRSFRTSTSTGRPGLEHLFLDTKLVPVSKLAENQPH